MMQTQERPVNQQEHAPRRRVMRTRFGRSRVLSLLLALAIGGHVWVASLRMPVPSTVGHGIRQPTPPPSPPQTVSFRVATYNIQRGKGTDGVHDIRRTARVLEGMDLVGLNELSGPSLWGGPDQAEQLGRRLSIGWLFVPNQRRWYHDYFGNGLLSRFPVKDWWSDSLPYESGHSRSFRNLIRLETVIQGRTVPVFVTHLDWMDIRKDQLRIVLDRFVREPVALLLADFNTSGDDPQIQTLLADANNVDAIHEALREGDPPQRIDWIITRGFRVLSGGMQPMGVSDHPCFWVDLEIE